MLKSGLSFAYPPVLDSIATRFPSAIIFDHSMQDHTLMLQRMQEVGSQF